jgi:hypothetical protein
MDISKGNIVKFEVCPLAELILKKGSLTASIMETTISYVETILLTQLKKGILIRDITRG